ncbi:NADH-quinone oxidoreductase subunit NuoN [Bacillus sp. CECT 9360]|uniref:NADH-quinone oxidoreductase subunit NuoN n=1 Tax=Bacillus sp. CECT 9360 TaxID=2845821 RepID=UPI001E30E3DC|nr:NADH-quinone oxidoreductase subunit NuoN [Bacillus sp. CECT 9360]CAH0345095.1 NAD(P)H-quinone oxidoreductase subunit 2 [Bacillus sp. CECT 9360]
MDMETMLSYDWGAMAPEFIILGTAILLALLDLFAPKQFNRRSLAWLGLTGIMLALVSLLSLMNQETVSILYDTFKLDSFAIAFKLILLVGAALVILLAHSYEPPEGFGEYRGEFYYLFLAALLGSMVMSSSGDLITLFVGLELLSISSYILAGMRKKNLQSNESAMKYVINGGISTAVTLFGMSYLYGLTGTTNLRDMAAGMVGNFDSQFQYLFGLAFFMILVGLSFKIASAPFHMWAPDVYQGAPTPVTAFLSVISKTAGFVIIYRILIYLYITAPGDSSGAFTFLEKNLVYVAFLASATMIIGNVIALRSRNIKRLFAYSSIAQAGYVLVAVATLGGGTFLFDTVWFYLLAYMLMNLGAFAIIQLLTDKSESEDISEFAGLYKRSPLLAVLMAIFILSLAGIPGTAGFIGKLNIILGSFAVEPSHYVLASIMMGATVISYFYYFGILTQIFFRQPHTNEKMRMPAGISLVLTVCAIGTVLFGVAPSLPLDFLHSNFDDFSNFFQ